MTWDMFKRPVIWAWGGINVFVALAAFFGLENVSTEIKILGLLLIAFITATGALSIEMAKLAAELRRPVRIRTVLDGEHLYRGRVLLVLDRARWLAQGQILVLVLSADEAQIPVALLRVVTFTTENYPQCVVLKPLSDKTLASYLSDRTRWSSMTASPDIRDVYLEESIND